MTLQTRLVLQCLTDADRPLYGLEICRATNLASGTIYPILLRLEQAGMIRRRWEDPDESIQSKRPRRSYYELVKTDD